MQLGVKYIPISNPEKESEFLDNLSQRLADPQRILPGYLYMTDIYDSNIIAKLGNIFFTRFIQHEPDYIVTVETKGIPLALMTAKAFNKPLVIIRADSRVTEGSALSINYVSGSSKNRYHVSSQKSLTHGF